MAEEMKIKRFFKLKLAKLCRVEIISQFLHL